MDEISKAPETSRTQHSLPKNSCDCHSHIFGPLADFPLIHPPVYPLPEAPYETHVSFTNDLGVERSILVQPATYGENPTAILNAISRSNKAVRGIAVASSSVSDETLFAWKQAGIEGLRFTQMKTPAGSPYTGSVPFEDLEEFGPRLARIGLHAELWGEMQDLIVWIPRLASLDIPLVLNHLGMPRVTEGINHQVFDKFIQLASTYNVWIKLSLCRVGSARENYEDARPFHDAYIDAIPDRLLWGSDWPYIRKDPAPDAGKMLDIFCDWARDDSHISAILAQNPERLYNFDKKVTHEQL